MTVSAAAAATLIAPHLHAQDCHVLLAKKSAEGVSLERLNVPEGQTQIVQIGGASEYIASVVPYSPGISGDLQQLDEQTMLILRNKNGQLHQTIQNADGSQRELPVGPASALDEYDVRISITGVDGPLASFTVIDGNIQPDEIGPVIDVFQGQIPLGQNDYSITSEVYRRRIGPAVTGRVSLSLRNGYPMVRGVLADGTEIDLIVDTGGGSALVLTRSVLPDDVDLEPGYMLEYSEKGVRKLEYSAGGATGSFGIAGVISVSSLQLGSVVFEDVSAEILEDDQAKIIENIGAKGIVGLELLREADIVTFVYPQGSEESGELIFAAADDANTGDPAKGVPFVHAMNHLIVRAKANDTPITWILDTGAPDCILAPIGADRGGVVPTAPAREARGLDGGSTPLVAATIDSLTLGGQSLKDVPARVGPLSVLKRLGPQSGLLGNSALARFHKMRLDFTTRTMFLGE